MTGVEPSAIIAIHTRYVIWGLLTVAIRQVRRPRIRIDGQEVTGAAWGDNEIRVPPGVHDVEVDTRYMLPFFHGRAGTFVHVTEGSRVELEYAAPAVMLAPGSLGPPPQRSKGYGYVYGLVAVVGLAAAVACTVGALFA